MNRVTLEAFQDELQKIAGAPLIPHTTIDPGMSYPTTRFIPDPSWVPSGATPPPPPADAFDPLPQQAGGGRGLGLKAAIPLAAAAGLYALHRRHQAKKQEAQG